MRSVHFLRVQKYGKDYKREKDIIRFRMEAIVVAIGKDLKKIYAVTN